MSNSTNSSSSEECLALGPLPPISEGGLSLAESLVFPAYVISVALMLFGPEELTFGGRIKGIFHNNVYAPICGVLYLFIAHFFTGGAVEPLMTIDVIGEVIVEKFDIVLLIWSFAYVAISLDFSLFFKKAALHMVLRAKGDGYKLFRESFLLCSVLTFFTSNDVVTLSMTPILIYVGVFAEINNMIPLLIGQFVAANTASMSMYIGSPTNIILGDAAGMSFVDYLAWMVLPGIVATLTSLFMLYVLFVWFPVVKENVVQAKFKPLTQLDVDLLLLDNKPIPSLGDEETEKSGEGTETDLALENSSARNSIEQPGGDPKALEEELTKKAYPTKGMHSTTAMYAKLVVLGVCLFMLTISSFVGLELWYISMVSAVVVISYDIYLVRSADDSLREFFWSVLGRFPWEVGPYVVCMFSMVKVMTNVGFTGRFAEGMIDISGNSALSAAMAFGFVSAFMVNPLCDLPSTVFWADMVRLLCDTFSAPTYDTVILALLVGNNLGCYWTNFGALAGLMWIKILRTAPGSDRVIVPTRRHLPQYGLLLTGPVMVCSLLVVWLEVLIVQGAEANPSL